jgi:hypothetical protein
MDHANRPLTRLRAGAMSDYGHPVYCVSLESSIIETGDQHAELPSDLARMIASSKMLGHHERARMAQLWAGSQHLVAEAQVVR